METFLLIVKFFTWSIVALYAALLIRDARKTRKEIKEMEARWEEFKRKIEKNQCQP